MTKETPKGPIVPSSIPFDHQPKASPIIEHPTHPAMEPVAAIAHEPVASTGATLMPQAPTSDAGGAGRMNPVPDPSKGRPFLGLGMGDLLSQVVPAGRAAFPDQQKPAVTAQQKAAAEGYARLRVRFHNGALTVLSAKQVEGPLILPTTVGSGYVYEVTLGGGRVALEWLPDTGVSRAFTNIDRPEAHLGHEATELPSFEFTARIPLVALSPDTLPKMQIALHRVAAPPEGPLTAEPLSKQLGPAVTEIARIPGLELAKLETPAREDLSRILKLPTTPA